MKVKRLVARSIKDTRGDNTIEVSLQTNFGSFISSSPNGKSKGKFEAKSWGISLKEDIKIINKEFIKDINIKKFDDLKLLENIFSKRIGGNSMIAVEYVFLKALAKSQNKQVWEVINSRAKRFPVPVGNVIGGGTHSIGSKRVIQEFQFIPITNITDAVKINISCRKECEKILKRVDKKFTGKTNDENAWRSSLSSSEIIQIIQRVRKLMEMRFKVRIKLGLDVAASEFFKNQKYNYKSPKISRTKQQQITYMKELSNIFYYLEDPFEQNDFSSFTALTKRSKGLVVGDDLTVTNLKRLQLAFKRKAINSLIVKPNQIGSLIEVKKIIAFCKKHGIKIIFSHRSGETTDDILADLAFGFQANFIKTGVIGTGRTEKLNRLIKISRTL